MHFADPQIVRNVCDVVDLVFGLLYIEIVLWQFPKLF